MSFKRAVIGAVLLAVPAALLAAVTTTPSGAATGEGGVFVPITPARIADSGSLGQATPTTGKTFKVTGVAGVPDTGVSAVVVDVAANSTTGTTNVYATTSGQANHSSILSVGGDTAWYSNTAIVRPSTSGNITIWANSKAINFNVDIQGYFTGTSTEASTGGFVPLDQPTRLIATNTGQGIAQTKLTSGTAHTIQVGSWNDVPSDATAVFANVRVLNATGTGTLKIGAAGTVTSTSAAAGVNYHPNDYNDSGMSIRLNNAGKLGMYLTSGTADVIIDIQGYFTPGDDGASYTPLNNSNIYDSRDTSKLSAGNTRDVQVAGLAGLPEIDDIAAVTLTVVARDATGSAAYLSIIQMAVQTELPMSLSKVAGSPNSLRQS